MTFHAAIGLGWPMGRIADCCGVTE